jgi:hypothetical protein
MVSSQNTIGLGRPDLTGLVAGFLIGLNGFLPSRFEIVPSWDFTRRVARGELSVSMTVRGYVLARVLLFDIPCAAYRRRRDISYWLGLMKNDSPLQEV